MGTKSKVVIIIVEGESDEFSLSPIKKWIKDKLDVRIQFTGGDIFTKSEHRNQSVKATVGDYINAIIKEYKFNLTDIVAVIQVTDTDGTFINNSKVIIDSSLSVDKVYNDNEIKVRDNIIQRNIINRNNDKANKLRTMYNHQIFNFGEAEIPYFLLYFSCNLEHVLHDKRDSTKPEKKKLSRKFARMIKNEKINFEDFFNTKDFAVSGNFKETWEFIEEDERSLQRYSNFRCIFDILNSL